MTNRITSYNVCYTKLLRDIQRTIHRLKALFRTVSPNSNSESSPARSETKCEDETILMDCSDISAPSVLYQCNTTTFYGGVWHQLSIVHCDDIDKLSINCKYGLKFACNGKEAVFGRGDMQLSKTFKAHTYWVNENSVTLQAPAPVSLTHSYNFV